MSFLVKNTLSLSLQSKVIGSEVISKQTPVQQSLVDRGYDEAAMHELKGMFDQRKSV